MSRLSDEQVNLIAAKVLEQLQRSTAGNTQVSSNVNHTPSTSLGAGIFNDIDSAVKAAQQAHEKLLSMTLEKRNDIIANIRKRMLGATEELSRMAHEETGLGRYEDKIQKNRLVALKTPGTEILQPTAWSGDRGLTLMELAPYGVIGAITPVTNPTSTIICNTIGMVAAGNAVVFNVHPSAKKTSIRNIVLLNEAITEVGGPANVITGIAEPTVESATELMHHPGVRLLVVTGGGAVVKAAMNSGKRAICAGPGNPPAVVDETANIELAAKSIAIGASLDNNIICVLEKTIIAVNSITDELIEAFKRHNTVILTKEQFRQLEPIIFTKTNGPRKYAVVNKDMIGKNIQVILAKIGMNVPANIRLAVVEVDADHPLVWTEQMMPVMPLVRMPDVNSAIDLAKESEHGYAHTAIMHSTNINNMTRMARAMNCSIFVKNAPGPAGLGFNGEGYCSFSIASPTGEGLTNAKSFSRERRCTLVDNFRIV